VVLAKENQSFNQHHPGASRHPSSAEEGSLTTLEDKLDRSLKCPAIAIL
jgi:hypothetical protein